MSEHDCDLHHNNSTIINLDQCYVKVGDWVKFLYFMQVLFAIICAVYLTIKLRYYTPNRQEEIKKKIE